MMTDRDAALYLERARVKVDNGRVIYYITDDEHAREYNIPYINLAVLFLGQGTSLTQEAARQLSEEGVHVAFTGTGGSPLHMGALTTYHSTKHFRELLPVYMNEQRSLPAAKQIMQDRIVRMRNWGDKYSRKYCRSSRSKRSVNTVCDKFESRLPSCLSINELLGVEGQFSKGCYAAFAELANLDQGKFRRNAGSNKKDDDPFGLINHLMDHGNYLCYGMAGAALWGLGIPPHMAIFHGKTRAGGLVFDLADSFKDALVLPTAFGTVMNSKGNDKEKEKKFRARIISAFQDERILLEAIKSIESMIAAGSRDLEK